MDADYELMPHQTIEKIKHELEVLKKKAGNKPSKEFQESMDKLNSNINGLMNLFKDAAEDMKIDEKEPGLKEQIEPLVKRLDDIENENKQIAEGILVVADMLKEIKEKKLMPVGRGPMPVGRGPMPVGRGHIPAPGQMRKPVFRPAPQSKSMAPGPAPMGPGGVGSGSMPPKMASMPPPNMDMGRIAPMPPPLGRPPIGPGQIGAGQMPPKPMLSSMPLPEIRAGPKKEGFLSKLFKKKTL